MTANILRGIRLANFRCFESLSFQPAPGRTFIVGDNAQGKTSVLEAVCVLLRLQSPRTSSLAEAVRAGTQGFSLDGNAGPAELCCKWSGGTRVITLDGKTQARSEDYLNTARVAWFANTDMNLVCGPGADRRRFLDFAGQQSLRGYRQSLRAYERALRSRNALLREGRSHSEVAAFDAPLCEHGQTLLEFRARLVALLAPHAAAACHEISGQGDTLEIAYEPGATLPFHDALAASRAEEDRLRQTTVGPHRDDLSLTLNGMTAASFASEGQQRTIALALKLAQARHIQSETGAAPVHLIDDVFGELDPARRRRLLAALPAEAQTIITTTFLDWAESPARDNVLMLRNHSLHAH